MKVLIVAENRRQKLKGWAVFRRSGLKSNSKYKLEFVEEEFFSTTRSNSAHSKMALMILVSNVTKEFGNTQMLLAIVAPKSSWVAKEIEPLVPITNIVLY
ncbi:MAG: hypothetical protein NT111_03450 [Patescibacteria group bacterium]|nr:hypothetical protein [Patescibacteria group bacterium]